MLLKIISLAYKRVFVLPAVQFSGSPVAAGLGGHGEARELSLGRSTRTRSSTTLAGKNEVFSGKGQLKVGTEHTKWP